MQLRHVTTCVSVLDFECRVLEKGPQEKRQGQGCVLQRHHRAELVDAEHAELRVVQAQMELVKPLLHLDEHVDGLRGRFAVMPAQGCAAAHVLGQSLPARCVTFWRRPRGPGALVQREDVQCVAAVLQAGRAHASKSGLQGRCLLLPVARVLDRGRQGRRRQLVVDVAQLHGAEGVRRQQGPPLEGVLEGVEGLSEAVGLPGALPELLLAPSEVLAALLVALELQEALVEAVEVALHQEETGVERCIGRVVQGEAAGRTHQVKDGLQGVAPATATLGGVQPVRRTRQARRNDGVQAALPEEGPDLRVRGEVRETQAAQVAGLLWVQEAIRERGEGVPDALR
mmetsp:Transcript_21815/g.68031  ORF Transcript_21815/g.68031 Transcript_21815/m.68031 type:complete len:341 (+) Transcript_21815:31-1053(+)